MSNRFNYEKRIQLETLLKTPFAGNLGYALVMSKKIPKIAEIIGVHASSIYREVHNRGFTYETYNAELANKDNIKKVSDGNTHYGYSIEQKDKILSLIKEFGFYDKESRKCWSPNAIKMRIEIEIPKLKIPSLETIYQWVYEDSLAGGKIYKYLPREHKKRKQHKNARATEVVVSNKTSIHQRDKVVDNRERDGDIEVDSVVGPHNKSGCVTVGERKSRHLRVAKVQDKTSNAASAALIKLLAKAKVKTITSDNGSEFAGHEIIAKTLKTKFYFADPYSSYQRGSNEHLNGMLRRFYPKGTDFHDVPDNELQQNVHKINLLPRKILNGKTAHEVLHGINRKLLTNNQKQAIICAFRS
jgi:IS30 family transposase